MQDVVTWQINDNVANITLPVLYPDGSQVIISITEKENGNYFVSDAKGAFDFLDLSCSPEIDLIMEIIERNYGINLENGEIYIEVEKDKILSAITLIATATMTAANSY